MYFLAMYYMSLICEAVLCMQFVFRTGTGALSVKKNKKIFLSRTGLPQSVASPAVMCSYRIRAVNK